MVAACLREEALGTLSLKAEGWAISRYWLRKGKKLVGSGGWGVKEQGAGYRERMVTFWPLTSSLPPPAASPTVELTPRLSNSSENMPEDLKFEASLRHTTRTKQGSGLLCWVPGASLRYLGGKLFSHLP